MKLLKQRKEALIEKQGQAQQSVDATSQSLLSHILSWALPWYWTALVSSYIKTLKNETELVAETLAGLNNMMRLSVWEEYISVELYIKP